MISVPLVYVIHLINILMEHHPHLNLQNKKGAPMGFEPWSARWEGRELPLSYNMISIPFVYVIPLINILIEHHPHLNLQNKKRCTHGI
jgi:hypothetical protein